MVKAGSVSVGLFALFLGLLLGVVGLWVMAEAGSFGSAEREQHSSFLGLWGDGSSESASINTGAFIGLIVALVGASALLFGLRALFVSFEGRGA